MNIFLLIGLAKANDYFKRPWLFAALYASIQLFQKLLVPSWHATAGSIVISIGFSFIAVGLLLSLLLRFVDNILMWVVTLAAGIFVLSGGASLVLRAWLA